MKKTLLLFLCMTSFVYGQTLHHQTLSSQGTSVELYNGMHISQTIGQQSVTGNSTKNGFSIGQGYQQSVWSKYTNPNSTSKITTITYPNPFIQSVNFQFSMPINDVISVSIFDILGRLIFQDEKKVNGIILTIELEPLPVEKYLVRLSAKNYTYYTIILKQQ